MKMKKIICAILPVIIALSIIPGIFAAAADENLALGKDYNITYEAKIDNAFPAKVISDETKKLTDGKKAAASANYNDSTYLRFFRGVYATVEFDMGKEVYVKGFSMGFNAYTDHGVVAPREIYFKISKDGENWFTLYKDIDHNRNAVARRQRDEFSFSSNDYYEARYIRIVFSSDVHSAADEIEIYGTEEKVASKSYDYDKPTEYPNAFAPNNNPEVDNIKNLVLMYSGEHYSGANPSTGHNSYDALLPYAAYVDRDKNILDTMFDSFLFLPLNPGDSPAYSLSKQSGWEAFLNNVIGKEKDINLTALNKVVGDTKAALNLDSSYKANIFIAVPYATFYSDGVFGKLDGNTDVRTDSLDSMLKIVKWYVDKAIGLFNEQGFEHLNLSGFYWHSELVYFGTYNPDLIKGYNEYVHSKGYGSIWIPYYCAPGAHMWKELGFDVACLQAGYAFIRNNDQVAEVGNQKEGNVYDAMTFAKKYGLGVEIEISGGALERYNDYIVNGAKLGCMQNGVTMFYQDGGPGVFYNTCYSSTNRHIYDLTYKYIKTKYEIHPPVMNYEGTILIEKNTNKGNGTLPVSDEDTAKNRLKITNLTQASHGKVTIDGDGFFTYAPEKDYVGEDSFSFALTDGINVSEVYTVNILVVEKLYRYTLVNTSAKDSGKAVLYTEGESTNTSNADGQKVFEVAVNGDGIVISAAYTTNTSIPEGGYVLSAAGIKGEELESFAKVGDKAVIDTVTKSVYFTENTPVENSEDESTPSKPDKQEDKDGNNIVLWVAIAVIVVAGAVVAVIIIKKPKNTNKE